MVKACQLGLWPSKSVEHYSMGQRSMTPYILKVRARTMLNATSSNPLNAIYKDPVRL